MMRINGQDIGRFGGELITKTIQPCEIGQNGEWMPGALLPLISDKSTLSYSSIEAQILVSGQTLDETTLRCSNIVSVSAQCRLNFDDLQYGYEAELISHDVEKVNKRNHLLMLEFRAGLKTGKERSLEMDDFICTVAVPGNTDAPAVLELRPQADCERVRLRVNDNLMEVRDTTKGQTIIIDGEYGLVTADGKNKYSDTVIEEYPVFHPGKNQVSVDNARCKVTIKFKPRWK